MHDLAGGSQEAGEALSQPSPRIALSQEQASQTTPSPGPFKMELKAKATPSPLQKCAQHAAPAHH